MARKKIKDGRNKDSSRGVPSPSGVLCSVTGKQMHLTAAKARLAKKAAKKGFSVKTHTYVCPHCGGWHLTSQKRY